MFVVFKSMPAYFYGKCHPYLYNSNNKNNNKNRN